MIQFLSKKTIKSVFAYSATTAHKMECEDVITVNFKFSDGTLGNLQANTYLIRKLRGSIILFLKKPLLKLVEKQ